MIRLTYALSESLSIFPLRSIRTTQRGYCNDSKNQLGFIPNVDTDGNPLMLAAGLDIASTLIFLYDPSLTSTIPLPCVNFDIVFSTRSTRFAMFCNDGKVIPSPITTSAEFPLTALFKADAISITFLLASVNLVKFSEYEFTFDMKCTVSFCYLFDIHCISKNAHVYKHEHLGYDFLIICWMR